METTKDQVEKRLKGIRPFGYPLHHWVIIASLATTVLGSVIGGTYSIGGTPNQISASIEQQTDSLSKAFTREISEVHELLELHTNAININNERHAEAAKRDSTILNDLGELKTFTKEAITNLDGYFQGRRDQALEGGQ